jgi:hypothetical protein
MGDSVDPHAQQRQPLTLLQSLSGQIPEIIECYQAIAATVPHLKGI